MFNLWAPPHYLQINAGNPLGLRGEMANSFGQLMHHLWSGTEASVVPKNFKSKLGKFAPQFSGYTQQDTQELLAFLLDGLHEDLNRVKQKPYIESKDSDNRPDDEVADEAWNYHLQRNNSKIVELFQGQYKSTLVCPVCACKSVTFDPFMYLSLPLPATSRTIKITCVTADGTALPATYGLKVGAQFTFPSSTNSRFTFPSCVLTSNQE
jgi:ubiquitin carboxyl-terminal hydrolase 4/11/15